VGPARIGYLLGLHPSTVHRVLTRYRLARLSWLERATGRVVRRYEWSRPGELVHVDIKKLGKIPDGGGWRILGRAAGGRNSQAHPAPRNKHRNPIIGYHYLHTAIISTPRSMTIPGWPTPSCCPTNRASPSPSSGHVLRPGSPRTDSRGGRRFLICSALTGAALSRRSHLPPTTRATSSNRPSSGETSRPSPAAPGEHANLARRAIVPP